MTKRTTFARNRATKQTLHMIERRLKWLLVTAAQMKDEGGNAAAVARMGREYWSLLRFYASLVSQR